MAQRMMWDHILAVYRGQATNGTVVVVEPPAMELAHKKAGKTVYDSDWWVETVQSALEHWGIYPRRWVDAATHVPRLNYSLTPPTNTGTLSVTQAEAEPSTMSINRGSLANQSPFVNSGPLPNLPNLNSAPLDSDSLGNSGLLPSKDPSPTVKPAPINSGPLGSRGLLPNGGRQPDDPASSAKPVSGPLLNRLKSGPLNKDRK